MIDERYENSQRFAVMLKDWLTRRGVTTVDEITWHDIFLSAGLAHFDLVPNGMTLTLGPGPDDWDPSEWKSDEELLGEMLYGQAEAELSFIEEFAGGMRAGLGQPRSGLQEDPSRMRRTAEYLASPELAGRAPGTRGGLLARDFIRDAFEDMHLEPAGSDGFDQPIPGNGGVNLLGIVRGYGPRSDRYVVLAAHFDHLGELDGRMYLGANDNAAAVAVMLEVARHLPEAYTELDRSVLVCAFDAEEPPHFLTERMGSIHFVNNPTIPLEQIDAMICLDLVGASLGPEGLPDAVRQSIFVLGAESGEGLSAVVNESGRRNRGIIPRTVDNYVESPMSDYYAFQEVGIPHLFYTGGRNEHYHQPSDMPDRLDYQRMRALTAHLVDLIASISSARGNIAYIPEGSDDRGTVDSLVAMARLLADDTPEATQALALLEAMGRKIDAGEALDASDRGTIQILIRRLEQSIR